MDEIASYVYVEYVDKLLDTLANGFTKTGDLFDKMLELLTYAATFIVIDLDFVISLAKGFLLGNVVLFAMCYLDWH